MNDLINHAVACEEMMTAKDNLTLELKRDVSVSNVNVNKFGLTKSILSSIEQDWN